MDELMTKDILDEIPSQYEGHEIIDVDLSIVDNNVLSLNTEMMNAD